MLAVLVGIALVVVAVVLWLGNLSLVHAMAILIGAVGVLLVCYWAFPAGYARRHAP